MGIFSFYRQQKSIEHTFGKWAYEIGTQVELAITHHDAKDKYYMTFMLLKKYNTNFIQNIYSNIDAHIPELKQYIENEIRADRESFVKKAGMGSISYMIALFCIAGLLATKKEIPKKEIKTLVEGLDLTPSERDEVLKNVSFSYDLQKEGLRGGVPPIEPWELTLMMMCGFKTVKNKETQRLNSVVNNMLSDGLGTITINTIESIIGEYEDCKKKNLGSIFNLNSYALD